MHFFVFFNLSAISKKDLDLESRIKFYAKMLDL